MYLSSVNTQVKMRAKDLEAGHRFYFPRPTNLNLQILSAKQTALDLQSRDFATKEIELQPYKSFVQGKPHNIRDIAPYSILGGGLITALSRFRGLRKGFALFRSSFGQSLGKQATSTLTRLNNGLAQLQYKSWGLWIRAATKKPSVAVKDLGGQKGLFATDNVKTNHIIGYFYGKVLKSPGQHSITASNGWFITTKSSFRFLNHKCIDANARMGGRYGLVVKANRPIRAGEEITIDYTRTEKKFSAPFACTCGSKGCRGRIA